MKTHQRSRSLLIPFLAAAATALGCSANDNEPCRDCVADAGAEVVAPQSNEVGPVGAYSACPVDNVGPSSTPEVRRTLPWTFVPSSADAGSPGDSAVTACTFTDSAKTCSAEASVHVTSDGPELTLAGFGLLRWNLQGMSEAVAQPTVVEGGSVWLAYCEHQYTVCPFCGGYYDRSVEIRDRQGGKILWLGSEGSKVGDMPVATQMELFGASATLQVDCEMTGSAGCYTFDRLSYDHELGIAPAVVIHHATLETVTAPTGTYQVYWAYSQENSQYISGCMDGPDVASDSGYAVSLVP
jgi:hypothetical protein